MRRLKCEKETIILTNEDDGFYDVYTFNQSLQKRLRAFAEKYPDDCWLKGSSEDGSETYMIKKGRLSLNLRPPYSKDRIHKATERIIEEQKEQSKKIHRMQFMTTMKKIKQNTFTTILRRSFQPAIIRILLRKRPQPFLQALIEGIHIIESIIFISQNNRFFFTL